MENNSINKYTNSLIHESSPYLLQHAHNPVNWRAWSNDAFTQADKENKLVLISIGYAACHWCHVMEHQSFENEEIAEIMNSNFVCIKVDREERPDVDQVYMAAVQMLTGSGGWPLNCFTLPDGRPIYGGTYYTPEQWNQVLQALAKTFNEEPERVLKAADEIYEGIHKQDVIHLKSDSISEFTLKQADNMFENWVAYFDNQWGGNKRAPKFPMPVSLEFLMQYAQLTKNKIANDHLHLTLNKMAQGGIYDQIGGGFARYSVDAEWKVPHFEKMLYDNGQLASLYAHAYKSSGSIFYLRVLEQTLEFIKREMTTIFGTFYSSFDADSEGVEGKFYVWKKAEIEAILESDATWFCEYFNVTTHANWEEGNILWVTNTEKVPEKYNFSTEQFYSKLDAAQSKLLKARSTRVYPALDDKILSAWNALISIGYIDAYEALGKQDYLTASLNNARFFKNKLETNNGQLFRNYKNEKLNINGFLDDYALMIQLFTKLYQNTFDEQWLKLAKSLLQHTISHFYDTNSGMFFYTSDLDRALVARKMELSDNVIPASNSIMANNLFDLSILFENEEWKTLAQQMLSNVINEAEQHAFYYGNWGILLTKFTHSFFEVVFVGENALELRKQFALKYKPNTIVAGLTSNAASISPLLKNRWVENETLIYVCKNNTCELPVKTVTEVLNQLN